MLTIFVPAEDSELRTTVRTGSGMVGSEIGETGRLRVDFEGNEDLFPTFGERVRRAAERHAWTGPAGEKGYPTRACAYISSSDNLVPVGSYDPERDRVAVDDLSTLMEWLDTEEISPEELSTE